MRVGGVRKVVIPSKFAYGPFGVGCKGPLRSQTCKVPPSSIIEMTVELTSVIRHKEITTSTMRNELIRRGLIDPRSFDKAGLNYPDFDLIDAIIEDDELRNLQKQIPELRDWPVCG